MRTTWPIARENSRSKPQSSQRSSEAASGSETVSSTVEIVVVARVEPRKILDPELRLGHVEALLAAVANGVAAFDQAEVLARHARRVFVSDHALARRLGRRLVVVGREADVVVGEGARLVRRVQLVARVVVPGFGVVVRVFDVANRHVFVLVALRVRLVVPLAVERRELELIGRRLRRGQLVSRHRVDCSTRRVLGDTRRNVSKRARPWFPGGFSRLLALARWLLYRTA